MALQFAQQEIEDAQEQLEKGNLEAAKRFVKNAKADVDDFGNLQEASHARLEKFEMAVEAVEGTTDQESLQSYLNRIEYYLNKFAEAGV